MDHSNNDNSTTGRRRYLAAVATSLGLSGCLQFSESDTITEEPELTSNQPETTSQDSTAQERPTQTETDTSELPAGTKWIARAQAPFISGPIVVDGTVLATSLDRQVYAFNAETGTEQWTVASKSKLDNGLSVLDGTAVAAGFDEQLGITVNDGTVTYRKQAGSESGARTQVAADGAVYQCGIQGGVRALDPATGKYLWTAPSDEPRVSVDHDSDTVCVGLHPTGHHGAPPWAYAGFDAATGEQLWSVERNLDASSVHPQVAVAGGTCLAYNGSDHHMRIDARSGEVQTEVMDSGIRRLYGTSDKIFVLDRGTDLQGIDGATGDTIWTTTAGSGRYDATYLDTGTFWHLSNKTLYKADVATGDATTVGELSLDGASIDGTGVEDGLAVAEETVFVTTSDARLRALKQP